MMTEAPDWKDQLKVILQENGNQKCADCFIANPDWGVHNLGLFVCIKCSGIHRQLGVHISKVKSTQFDKWNIEQLDYVRERGNEEMNKIFEANLPSYVIRPNETENESIRRIFITNKYQFALYKNEENSDNSDNKQNDNNLTPVCKREMPLKVQTGAFLEENGKKKIYFQLLSSQLYYFRYPHDSYDFDHWDVTSLDCSIYKGGTNDREPILQIKDTSKNKILFRVRSRLDGKNVQEIQKVEQLVSFCEEVRCANNYYKSDASHEEKSEYEPSKAKKQLTTQDLSSGSCTILGIANKKGGGARNWRKRWWVLDSGILYYFKDDFRTNKKANGIGVPQGDIPLFEADVTWDKDKARTNKQNALIICTHKRTFYIQPTNENAKSFYNAVNVSCDNMWNRKIVDFSQIVVK